MSNRYSCSMRLGVCLRKKPVMRPIISILVIATALSIPTGCHSSSRVQQGPLREQFGKTFYLDGAGNWGWGQTSVAEGLRRAGYRGDTEVFLWTTSLVPLIDQWNIIAARIRAHSLAAKIAGYHRRYPGTKINIIALSAGTGVAAWAIEDLPQDITVSNLVMLGSSLSHNYDIRKALAKITGSIYVYYSPLDGILPHTFVIGTIDGRHGVEAAGMVGLDVPPGDENRIVNIAWSPDARKLGWEGGHVDATNPIFVANEIAPRILTPLETAVNGTSAAAHAGATR